MIITSKSNNIIKYICSLDNKKYRNKYNKYVIEGIKMVEEIINSEGYAPEFIVYSKDILNKGTLGSKFISILEKKTNKYNMVEVNEEVFNYMSSTETPQGVMAVIDKKEYNIQELEQTLNNLNNQKFIILDKIQDPGNLGTIIRSSLSFGIKNIICIEGTTDAFSSKVVRSTMSGILKANLFYIKEDEITKLADIFKNKGYTMISTDLTAEKYVNEEDIDDKTIFVMGNEANGVSQEIKNICDKFVKIPMESTMESLNVAIASSIVMYEQYINGMKNK